MAENIPTRGYNITYNKSKLGHMHMPHPEDKFEFLILVDEEEKKEYNKVGGGEGTGRIMSGFEGTLLGTSTIHD